MAKEEAIQLLGHVTDCLPNAMFKVKIESGTTILAYLGGKLRQHSIDINLGDRVTLECSPYDLSRGRIVYRNKS
jgi:translation initiation factor IF-1